MISYLKKSDNVEKGLKAMVERAKTMTAVLNGPVYRAYQAAQMKRWETQGRSEGSRNGWADNKEPYRTEKRSRFAAFPGEGSHVMVATSRLANAAIGRDSSGFTKIATDSKLIIRINLSVLPYAAYPAEERPFMAFGTDSVTAFRGIITKYIMRGYL